MAAFVVGLAVVVVTALLARDLYRSRVVGVAADIALIRTEVDLDPVLFHRLADVRGAALAEASHGHFVLATRRVPAWAAVAMVVTLPLGLLFLMVRTERRLTLALSPDRRSLRVTGSVEAQVWRRVSRALAPLVADREPAPVDLRTRR